MWGRTEYRLAPNGGQPLSEWDNIIWRLLIERLRGQDVMTQHVHKHRLRLLRSRDKQIVAFTRRLQGNPLSSTSSS
eukprot:674901-Hanusia_phi.AAC.1